MRLLILLLTGTYLHAQSSINAVVTVDTSKTIKQFDRRLVGSNVEWFYDGNGIYDPDTKSLRTPIVDRAQEMGVGLIRFPGGTLADSYDWRNGVGPNTNRPVRSNFLSGGDSANSFGTPEVLELSKRLGADILMQANVITGTAGLAASWVNYCNNPANASRIRDGFPTPYKVKYWEIGNEQYMDPTDTPTPESFLSASTYSSRFRSFANAMKSVDPTIKVGAITGKNFGRFTLLKDPNWNRTLLQSSARYIDFLAIHNAYSPIVFEDYAVSIDDVYPALWAFPMQVEANLADIRNDIKTYAPSHANRIEFAITEWGALFNVFPHSPWIEHTKTMGSAIYVANILQIFARTPLLTMGAHFKLTENSFMGLIQDNGVLKPAYYALQMFGKYFGPTVVQTTVNSSTYNSKAIGLVAATNNVPYLDVVTSLSADGKKLYMIAVNKHRTSAARTTLNLAGFSPKPTFTERVLTAASLDANNGPSLPQIPGIAWAPQITLSANSLYHDGSPGRVATQTTQRTLTSNVYSFAPLSVTALEFTRAN